MTYIYVYIYTYVCIYQLPKKYDLPSQAKTYDNLIFRQNVRLLHDAPNSQTIRNLHCTELIEWLALQASLRSLGHIQSTAPVEICHVKG